MATTTTGGGTTSSSVNGATITNGHTSSTAGAAVLGATVSSTAGSGTLPVTGVNSTFLAAVAGLLVAGGLVLMLMARLRRNGARL